MPDLFQQHSPMVQIDFGRLFASGRSLANGGGPRNLFPTQAQQLTGRRQASLRTLAKGVFRIAGVASHGAQTQDMQGGDLSQWHGNERGRDEKEEQSKVRRDVLPRDMPDDSQHR